MDCLCGVQRGLFLTVMRFETLALMEASSWVLLGWRHRMVIDLLCWSSGLAAEGISDTNYLCFSSDIVVIAVEQ
jgi:hypothetical protein